MVERASSAAAAGGGVLLGSAGGSGAVGRVVASDWAVFYGTAGQRGGGRQPRGLNGMVVEQTEKKREKKAGLMGVRGLRARRRGRDGGKKKDSDAQVSV